MKTGAPTGTRSAEDLPESRGPALDETAGSGSHSCSECGQSYKTAQGLAGHRRLAHSSSTRSELEAREGKVAGRESAAKKREAELVRQAEAHERREADLARREREIAETGPAALGYARCAECEGWLSKADIAAHARAVHPLDRLVAIEVGVSKDRVGSVWREAARKQERYPSETPEQIVRRFWGETDQRILKALLARNAVFRFAREG